MARGSTTTILLQGEIYTGVDEWLKWYEFTLDEAVKLGFTPNYLGVTGEQFKSSKLTTVKRKDAVLREAIKRGDKITSISIYSLPSNFKTAAFDYELYLSRATNLGCPRIMLTISTEAFSKIDYANMIEKLKKHICFVSGQVFEIVGEDPLIYAIKANPPSSFKTLRIITEL
ncbi:hypothetical protein [Sporomusa sphaeroides]|uniref:hypothetical protein n=1 Tax=Sporomusa sphaeroides TaxID=47679 RepID=UPI002C897F1D|nr:hypothetical protein [Sporomusa sphaeroides]HML35657.1 hypothetical protein [Sporomusa sphaeroides]